jgi:hypothetical protein
MPSARNQFKFDSGLLVDPELFGNEAGEDENPDILASYFVEKPEYQHFFSSNPPFLIVKSKKGVGKSALLARGAKLKREDPGNQVVLYLKGADLTALSATDSFLPNDLINSWQLRICSRINGEIARHLPAALSDNAISLVETAELNGFRDRNIVSALLDRLIVRTSPLESKKGAHPNPHALLQRFAEKNNPTVWLFIDDIDATFLNNEAQRIYLSTFFTACRYLSNSVRGLRIRASVRSDVWSILAQKDEALDKCEQYITDLTWSTNESRQILSRKLKSFFQRKFSEDPRFHDATLFSRDIDWLRLVFSPLFRWGGRDLPPDRPLYILSNGRPRWSAHLCKLAARHANASQDKAISVNHITRSLMKYGEARLSDLYKEHGHQCPRLEAIIETFSLGRRSYTSNELFEHIDGKIIKPQGMPELDGIPRSGTPVDVGHFLFRIGFICGRDQQDSGALSFVRYEDRPNLLSTPNNMDDGLNWDVHPSYRQVLKIA